MSGTAEVAAVPVEWAVLSKHPERFGGYEVLAASGDRARAEQLIQAAHTGAPGERRQEPDVAGPWTTFLGDGASRPSLGVVERTQTAVPDVTGRPISVARLLTVPWPAPDGPRVGFLGLQRIAGEFSWPTVDGPPGGVADGQALTAAVQPPDVEVLARTIDEIGFRWVLAAAVALLDGDQVVITAGERALRPKDRVRVLDAVCALLPYGCRAWLSAATWADNRRDHQVRLSVAAACRGAQKVIPLSGPEPDVALRTPAAASYRAEMMAVKNAGFATTLIVEHLLKWSEPLPFEQNAAAVGHLQEMRLGDTVDEEVRAGRGDPLRVERVLAGRGWSVLPQATRSQFAHFLASTARIPGPPARVAQEVLTRHWDASVADELAGLVAAELTTERSAARSVDYFAAAAAVGDVARDQLVAAVLVAVSPPPRRAVSPQVAVRTVSLLVRTQSLALDNTAAWQVLAESPELGAGLLQGVLAAKGENRLGRVLEALSPFARNRGAEWVGAAGELFHDARVRLPAGDWPAPVWRVWLAIAVARDQGAAFLSSGWRFVLGEAFGADEDGRFPEVERMAAVVHGVPMDGIPPPVLATADVLSLAIGGPMTHLARPIDPAYLDALGAVWAEVSPTGRAQLAPRLVGAVLGRRLTPSSFADLRAVVDQLGAELAPPAVEEVGRRLISQADLLVQLALDRSWAEDLLRHAPKHGWLRTWFDVHDLARQPGVDPIVLGERYAQLLGQHAELAPAMAAIQPWLQAERAPEELVRLLRGIDERSRSEVLRHLMRANRGNPDATTALLAYVEGEERRLRQQARAFASLREEARRFLDAPPSRPEGAPTSLSPWLRRLFGNQEPSDRPGREQHDRT